MVDTILINLFVWSKKGTGGCIQSLWGGRSKVAMVDLLSGEVAQFNPFQRLEWTAAVAMVMKAASVAMGPALTPHLQVRKK